MVSEMIFNRRNEIASKYVMLWTLLMMVPGAYCYSFQMQQSETDVLSETQEATLSVLRASGIAGCSLLFATQKERPFTTLNQVSESVGMEASVGVFQISTSDVNNSTHSHLTNILDDIIEIRMSSSCTTLIVASDDEAFLSVLMEGITEKKALAWPARLLLVTRLPRHRLRPFREELSNMNAMVIILQKAVHWKRCGVYLYLPYSFRQIQTASWNAESGLTYLGRQRLYPDKFRKFVDGAHFVVAGMNYPPHFRVIELSTGNPPKKTITYSGPLKMLLDMLSSHVNFTYSIRQPTEGAWGYVSPNGTWNGMIGMVLRKEVDFALGPFARIYIRATVVDYADPLIVIYARIIGRRGNSEVDPWSFIMPLAPMVWAATFATLVAILILIIIIAHITRSTLEFSPKISLGTYIRSFLQQNIDMDSNKGWEMMVLGSWMLTVLVLLEAYSTNLISLLAVRHITEPYHSVREVMDDPTVKMLWFANSAYMQFLAAADSGIFREVYDSLDTGKIRLIYTADFIQFVDNLVSRGDHVVIHPYLSMKLFLTEEFLDSAGKCKYYASRERFMPMDFSPIVAKYSPLRGPLNEGIRAAAEGGLYNYWVDSSMTNPKSCKKPPTKITVKEALSLTNIWGMFVTLVGGYIISILTLCLEIASVKFSVIPKSVYR